MLTFLSQSEAFEHMWHLVIPPVMTLLDDFEVRYKLQGVIIVQEMLLRLPKELIKRTGVDGLIQQVLSTTISHGSRYFISTLTVSSRLPGPSPKF